MRARVSGFVIMTAIVALAACRASDEGALAPTPSETSTTPPWPVGRCFVITSAARDRERCGDLPADGEPVSFEGAKAIPIALGTVLCVEADRLSFRPISGRWNQALVGWRCAADESSATAVGLDLSLTWDPDGASTIESGCVFGHLAPTPAAWIEDAKRLPRVEAICARMRRCVGAVARAFPSPDNDAPPPELPADLLGCADYQARTTKLVPSPPPECD